MARRCWGWEKRLSGEQRDSTGMLGPYHWSGGHLWGFYQFNNVYLVPFKYGTPKTPIRKNLLSRSLWQARETQVQMMTTVFKVPQATVWKALEVGAAVSWPGRGEPRRWTSQEAAPGTETGRHREQRPHHQQMRRVNLAPALTCRVATAALLNV